MRRSIGSVVLIGALVAHGVVWAEGPSTLAARPAGFAVWPQASAAALEETAEPAGGDTASARAAGAKSPPKALLLSAALPGAGQYYAGARRKAAVFLGLEAVAAGLWWAWTGKGNDIEDEFRAMADTSWNAETYLAWRGTTRAIRNNSFTHALPCSLQIEEGRFADCGGGEKQQYYELLGKYEQFVVGWRDIRDVETGNPVVDYSEVDSVESVESAVRLDYEKLRDDSNRYLKRATTITGLILVNHVISAIDAARTTRARAAGASAAELERRTRFLVALHPGMHGQVPMLVAYRTFR
ncbi:MAG: hypothetical protein AB1505_33265 [Candidatus Latescibacterota bacterium]